MKKFILILVLIIPLKVFAWEFFMDKCIASWIGYPLDSLMKSWGYPDAEKYIAGKKLYIWETSETSYNRDSGFTIVSTDKKGRETVFSSGGELEVEYCKKIIEVDENNIIINGQWKGNACPNFYIVGKKLVNPQNDEWAKKKANKNK